MMRTMWMAICTRNRITGKETRKYRRVASHGEVRRTATRLPFTLTTRSLYWHDRDRAPYVVYVDRKGKVRYYVGPMLVVPSVGELGWTP